MASPVNFQHRVDGNKLIIEVDLSEEHGESSTGKSVTIGSSGGFLKLDEIPGCEGMWLNCQVGRSIKKAKKAA